MQTYRFHGNGHKPYIFVLDSQKISNVSLISVPNNKLLANFTYTRRTGKHWPSPVFVRTSLRSVRIAMTSGPFGPRTWLARSYSCVLTHQDNGNSRVQLFPLSSCLYMSISCRVSATGLQVEFMSRTDD